MPLIVAAVIAGGMAAGGSMVAGNQARKAAKGARGEQLRQDAWDQLLQATQGAQVQRSTPVEAMPTPGYGEAIQHASQAVGQIGAGMAGQRMHAEEMAAKKAAATQENERFLAEMQLKEDRLLEDMKNADRDSSLQRARIGVDAAQVTRGGGRVDPLVLSQIPEGERAAFAERAQGQGLSPEWMAMLKEMLEQAGVKVPVEQPPMVPGYPRLPAH